VVTRTIVSCECATHFYRPRHTTHPYPHYRTKVPYSYPIRIREKLRIFANIYRRTHIRTPLWTRRTRCTQNPHDALLKSQWNQFVAVVTTCRDVAVAAGFNPSALYSLRVTVHATVIALHFPNSTNCVAASSITDDGYCFQDVSEWCFLDPGTGPKRLPTLLLIFLQCVVVNLLSDFHC